MLQYLCKDYELKESLIQHSKEVHTFNLSTLEAKAEGSLWGHQPGLHGELHDSQDYTDTLSQKKKMEEKEKEERGRDRIQFFL